MAVSALIAGAVLTSTATSVSSAATPQASTESPSETATDRLEAAFTRGFETSGASGATVGVWVPGQEPYVASKGVADRESGEPMTPEMQAPIGSVTKTYTVLVALQLVREGVLGLDDTIELWYPTYPEAANITLRMLMNHSSGVSDISEVQIELKCADHQAVLTPDELIDLSAGLPREPFAPGQGSSYSSANTIILGRILEKVTATGYEDLLTQRLFEPLGLDRTRLDDDGVLEAPFAHGYTNFCAPGLPTGIDTSSWPLIAFSGGALAATIDDLLAYGVAFGEGYGLDDELRGARIEQTAPGDPSSGLGLVVERDPATGGVVSLGHAGSVMGYGANLVYYPCTGTVFAVMANVDFSPALIDILREVQPVVQELATGPCAPAVVEPTTSEPAAAPVQPIVASPRFAG
ncbi:MAG TPA: serine hydrolase domain-containing protein [Acidimicrobiales bacterium]